MQLKDFVSQTLLAIGTGIVEAQQQGSKYGLKVAPMLTESGNVRSVSNENMKPHVVKFNLKIVIEDKKEDGKGGSGFSLQMASIGFTAKSGAQAHSLEASSQIQEISFEIPVLWPADCHVGDPVSPDFCNNSGNPF